MWSMILLMSRLPGGHSKSVGQRPEEPTVGSLLVGTIRRLVPTERSDRRLGRSATGMKGPRYPGTSPWTTVCQYGNHELYFLRDAQPIQH